MKCKLLLDHGSGELAVEDLVEERMTDVIHDMLTAIKVESSWKAGTVEVQLVDKTNLMFMCNQEKCCFCFDSKFGL